MLDALGKHVVGVTFFLYRNQQSSSNSLTWVLPTIFRKEKLLKNAFYEYYCEQLLAYSLLVDERLALLD